MFICVQPEPRAIYSNLAVKRQLKPPLQKAQITVPQFALMSTFKANAQNVV